MKHAAVPKGFLKHPVHLLAFGFGAGLSPLAPGTAGTVVGVLFYLILSVFDAWLYLTGTALLLIAGIWICQKTADHLQVHDHAGIVWDEIVGYLIAMAAIPVSVYTILLGFVLFRLFDIAKPWPIRWIDRKMHGGIGIMLDDVLAGVYAAISLYLIYAYFIFPV